MATFKSTASELVGEGVESDDMLPLDPTQAPTMSDDMIRAAQRVLDSVPGTDGCIVSCKQRLAQEGLLPGSSAQTITLKKDVSPDASTRPPTPPHILDEQETPSAKDLAIEYTLRNEDLSGDENDWAADLVDAEFRGSAKPLEPPVTSAAPASLTAEYHDSPQSTQGYDNWEKTLVSHLSTLYTSLKVGLDAVHAQNMELKEVIQAQHAELKIIREEQSRLGTMIGETQTRLQALHSLTVEGQSELLDMKREFSLCTASFSKINSALEHMNKSGLPIGKLPSPSQYVGGLGIPAESPLDEPLITTPIAYSREKLREFMIKCSFPPSKMDVMIKLLENRTPKMFAMLLPQLNPNATVSGESAQRLLALAKISEAAEIKQALACLRALITEGGSSGVSTTLDNTGPPSQGESTHTVTAKQVSRVIKCENPFASR